MPELQPGSVLHGTYTLVEVLGRGGMGIVWKASHTRLPRPLAIKVLNDAAYESEEVLQRFRREAEITSQLGHPNIIQVFDFNVLEDGRAYLVMEFLEGTSLRDRMRERPISEAEAATIVRQVGSALGRVHKEGIVHRDLKPENIFLCRTDDGSVLAKVLDFGISKVQGSMTVVTQDAALLGTPRYMSPEQARGENTKIDGATDQFALAAIAYEMLTGRPAFGGDSIPAVLHQVSSIDPEPMDSLTPSTPHRLGQAIHRALSKRREQRFADMTAFLQAFDSEAPTLPDESTVPTPVSRRAPLLIGGTVAVLGLAGALAFRAVGGASEPEVEKVEPLAELEEALVDAGIGEEVRPSAPQVPEDELSKPALKPRPSRVRTYAPSPQAKKVQAAVEAGQFRRALAIGRAELGSGAPDDVYVYMTAAYCGLKDLSGAKSMWRAVPRALRRRAARACRSLGLDVD
ncbi:MAG: protein kinase [Myxococcota bacterium]